MPVESAREVFEVHMPKRFADVPGLSARVNALYKFVLTGADGGTWSVDLTREPAAVTEVDSEADCTITAASSVFVDIVNGALSGQKAFLSGKLKVAGNLGLALKLGTVLGK
jgi:putative sterol carrier protein